MVFERQYDQVPLSVVPPTGTASEKPPWWSCLTRQKIGQLTLRDDTRIPIAITGSLAPLGGQVNPSTALSERTFRHLNIQIPPTEAGIRNPAMLRYYNAFSCQRHRPYAGEQIRALARSLRQFGRNTWRSIGRGRYRFGSRALHARRLGAGDTAAVSVPRDKFEGRRVFPIACVPAREATHADLISLGGWTKTGRSRRQSRSYRRWMGMCVIGDEMPQVIGTYADWFR